MSVNVEQLVAGLQRMTVTQLRHRYAEVHGEPTKSNNKPFLIRRIAWRTQANEEGDLAVRARRIHEKAMQIANDADLRLRAPSTPPKGNETSGRTAKAVHGTLAVPADSRLPMPGAMLRRDYRGRTISVRVLPKGFEYDGIIYRSLSAVARVVTGAHWNGYLFFGLRPPPPTVRTTTRTVARETEPAGAQP